MMLEFERDPAFRMDDVHDLTRPQVRERIMTRIPSMIKFIKNESVADFHKRLNILVLIDPGFLTRIGVHVSGMLFPCELFKFCFVYFSGISMASS